MSSNVENIIASEKRQRASTSRASDQDLAEGEGVASAGLACRACVWLIGAIVARLTLYWAV
jgi:hypothetical protein